MSLHMPGVMKPLVEDDTGHQWVVHATFTLSRAEALRASHNENHMILMDSENLHSITTIFCHRCELPYIVCALHTCPGDPKMYYPNGVPHFPSVPWVEPALKKIGYI